jgi:hypothetical protein
MPVPLAWPTGDRRPTALAELTMRDMSRAGHELGRVELDELPERLTVLQLLEHRVRHDVAAHARAPGRVFRGLVQPQDAVRHSDGHHLRTVRVLEPEPLVAAAHEAVAMGLLVLRVGDQILSDLDAVVDVAANDQVVAELRRSIVARDP